MPEEYQPSVFEKIIPLVDEVMLCEIKMQQLKQKGFPMVGKRIDLDKLEDISANAQIEIYQLLWQNKNQ